MMLTAVHGHVSGHGGWIGSGRVHLPHDDDCLTDLELFVRRRTSSPGAAARPALLLAIPASPRATPLGARASTTSTARFTATAVTTSRTTTCGSSTSPRQTSWRAPRPSSRPPPRTCHASIWTSCSTSARSASTAGRAALRHLAASTSWRSLRRTPLPKGTAGHGRRALQRGALVEAGVRLHQLAPHPGRRCRRQRARVRLVVVPQQRPPARQGHVRRVGRACPDGSQAISNGTLQSTSSRGRLDALQLAVQQAAGHVSRHPRGRAVRHHDRDDRRAVSRSSTHTAKTSATTTGRRARASSGPGRSRTGWRSTSALTRSTPSAVTSRTPTPGTRWRLRPGPSTARASSRTARTSPWSSHELAHQWYGDDVSVAGWKDIWVNEGFAGYAEWLWAEHEDDGHGAGTRRARCTPSHPADDAFWTVKPGDPGRREPVRRLAVYDRGARGAPGAARRRSATRTSSRS